MRRFLLLFLLLTTACRTAAPAALTRFDEWLEAYNSGDPARFRELAATAYSAEALRESSPEDRARGLRLWFMNYGTMKPAQIHAATDESVEVTVSASMTEGWAKLWVETEKVPPHKINAVWLSPFEPAPANARTARPLDDAALAADLNRLATKLAANDAFAGVVLVMHDGRAILQQAYGMADRDAKLPNTVDTRFELASVSKMFTAAAIARLAEDGRLSIDDPIQTALPDYPNARTASRITIRQLLTHTSGIPDFYRNGKYRQFRNELHTLKDHWKMFAEDELEFEPGARWSYSNSNYVLLGSIVEQVSGRAFTDFVRDEIFARADMRSTEYVSGGPRTARGYSRYTSGFGPMRKPDPDRWHAVPVESGSGGGPSGGGVSTAHDLASFGAALLAGRVVSKTSVERMLAGQAAMDDGGRYGFGLQVYDWSGTKFVGHGGAAWGLSNQVDLYPERGYVVVVLSNVDTSGAHAIAYRARNLLSAR